MSHFRRLAAQLVDFPETKTISYKAMKKLSLDDTSLSNKIIYHNYNKKTKEGILSFIDDVLEINNAFAGDRFLLSIDVPPSVTNIVAGAFEGCVNLHTVNFKNTITKINNNTFKNCKKLKNINIDNVLESVGNYAFNNCISLTDITFFENVTSIGIGCFEGCVNLTNVILPKKIKELSEYCFYNCNSLEFIDIPEGVTTLYKFAFNKDEGISANIPTTLNKIIINNTYFYGYSKVERWYFNNLYIKNIDNYLNITWAYSAGTPETIGMGKCKNLYIENNLFTEYTFSDDVTEIKACSFIGCQSLKKVNFPNNSFTIKGGAFSNCINLSTLNNFDNCSTIEIGAFSYCNLSTIDIPNITDIPSCFIAGNENITTVVIPNTVTKISSRAFYNCTGLQSVIIPDNVTTLEYGIFENCDNLQEVSLPNTISTIASYTFEGCKSLQEIYLPESITTIKNSAFLDCESLTNINLPISITTIESSVFKNCKSLTSINTDNITHILSEAFYGCKNIKNINTNSLLKFSKDAFDYCESLENITISKECTMYDSDYISEGLFIGCNNLNITLDEEHEEYSVVDAFLCNKEGTSILGCARPITECNIPNNITHIYKKAFKDRNFVSIRFGDNIDVIEPNLCENCKNLTNIDFNNVTTISTSSFEGCSSLVSVNFNNVSDITENAFANCTSLEEVTFLKGVYMHRNNVAGMRHINVFKDCVNLKYVNFSNKQTTLYLDIFENCTSFIDLYVSKNIKYISGSIRGSNIKNVHIESLDSWYDISLSPNESSLQYDLGFENPLYYAENLYLNGELVTDVVIDRNAICPFFGYKKLNTITIKGYHYVTGLTSISGSSITIENPTDGVGMIFDEINNLLWYGTQVSWNSTMGGLSSGNTAIENIISIKGEHGYGYRNVDTCSFLDNNTIEYILLEKARILPYAFFGSTKIKAFFIEEDPRIFGYDSINTLRLKSNCFGGIKSDYKIAIKDSLYSVWYDVLAGVNVPDIEDRVITETEWDYYNEIQ